MKGIRSLRFIGENLSPKTVIPGGQTPRSGASLRRRRRAASVSRPGRSGVSNNDLGAEGKITLRAEERKAEALRLAAEGMTNRQIAEADCRLDIE